MDISCLEDIIGLTDIECACIKKDRPDDWNVSESGYYLTDMEYGVSLQSTLYSLSECTNGQNIWQLMQKAIDEAKRDFISDLQAAMYNRYDSRYSIFNGNVGQLQSNGLSNIPAGSIIGAEIKPKKSAAGCFTIDHIYLGLSCDATIDVSIYSSQDPSSLIDTITINTVAGQFTKHHFAEPLEFSLNDESCSDLYYYAEYQLPEDCQPLNNKYVCCGKKFGWQQYMIPKGYYIDENGKKKAQTKWAYGFSFEGYMSCKGYDWICNLPNTQGFSMLDVVARTIQFRAISKLIVTILNSGNINFFTLLADKVLMGKRNSLKKMYYENIDWIVDNLPELALDCFKCKKGKKGGKQSILV